MCVASPNSCSDDNPSSQRNPYSHLHQLGNYTGIGLLIYPHTRNYTQMYTYTFADL